MPLRTKKTEGKLYRVANLSRLEALGDAVFAFALTLLALDIRLPQIASNALAQGLWELLPKLLVFVFAFLLIAQQLDVHQRTMMHIDHADGLFVWLYLLSLMFVVLMPASADILGRYPFQPLVLIVFGFNTALLCLTSWIMLLHASQRGKLLDGEIGPNVIKLIARLWLYPPLIIVVTIPLVFVSVYIVYAIWFLMPIFSYSYTSWTFRRFRKDPK